jgi:hypothetical protein
MVIGMNWVQDEIESSYLFEPFVGCLRNVQLKSGTDLTPVNPLIASAHKNIVEGCVDKFVANTFSFPFNCNSSANAYNYIFAFNIIDVTLMKTDVEMVVAV